MKIGKAMSTFFLAVKFLAYISVWIQMNVSAPIYSTLI